MKKKKFILPVFLFILSLIFCGGITQYSTVSVKAATTTKKQTGFVMKNGSWYYYDKNGKKATGWYQSVAGNKYYFGKTGAAKAGILTISGKKYCFNSKGKCLPGGRQSMERPISLMRKKDICTLAGLPQQLEINTISGMTEQ